jgi:hypothetical protein
MNWNGEVSLGNVLTILTFLFTLYTLHTRNIERFAKIEERVNLMWDRLKRRLDIPEEAGEEGYSRSKHW